MICAESISVRIGKEMQNEEEEGDEEENGEKL